MPFMSPNQQHQSTEEHGCADRMTNCYENNFTHIGVNQFSQHVFVPEESIISRDAATITASVDLLVSALCRVSHIGTLAVIE